MSLEGSLAKKRKLVQAAYTMFHRQGFCKSTLADIAQEANVPLGNIYYYFKTKDLIAEEVLKEVENKLKDAFELWQTTLNDPMDRITAFVQYYQENAESIAIDGSIINTLCSDFNREGGELSELSHAYVQLILKWLVDQYTASGMNLSAAQTQAYNGLAFLEGYCALACHFRDPTLLKNLNFPRVELSSTDSIAKSIFSKESF